MRIRAELAREADGWNLARATHLGGRAAWTKFECCTFPAERLPVHFATDPGLEQWALGPVLAGVHWWTPDSASHFAEVWDGGSYHGAFDTCGGGSYIGFADLRAQYGADIVGLGTYCSDDKGIFELHALLDAYVDYPLAQVAAHEWGHGIGLGHTADPAAVMYAYTNDAAQLSADDLAGLRALYPGPYALDVHAARTTRLTFGTTVDVDAPVRVVGGPSCDPQTMRVRATDVPPNVVLGGPRLADDRTVLLDADPTDPLRCRARFSVALSEPAGGSLNIGLAPWSSTGPVSGATQTVEVPLNVSPVAVIDVSPTTPAADVTATLLSRSFDVDGDALNEAWDLDGDGSYDDASGAVVTHRFSAGDHRVALQVSDGTVETVTVQTIRVSALPGNATTKTPTVPLMPNPAPASRPSGRATDIAVPRRLGVSRRAALARTASALRSRLGSRWHKRRESNVNCVPTQNSYGLPIGDDYRCTARWSIGTRRYLARSHVWLGDDNAIHTRVSVKLRRRTR